MLLCPDAANINPLLVDFQVVALASVTVSSGDLEESSDRLDDFSDISLDDNESEPHGKGHSGDEIRGIRENRAAPLLSDNHPRGDARLGLRL